jgi:hypothetical protein
VAVLEQAPVAEETLLGLGVYFGMAVGSRTGFGVQILVENGDFFFSLLQSQIAAVDD